LSCGIWCYFALCLARSRPGVTTLKAPTKFKRLTRVMVEMSRRGLDFKTKWAAHRRPPSFIAAKENKGPPGLFGGAQQHSEEYPINESVLIPVTLFTSKSDPGRYERKVLQLELRGESLGKQLACAVMEVDLADYIMVGAAQGYANLRLEGSVDSAGVTSKVTWGVNVMFYILSSDEEVDAARRSGSAPYSPKRSP